MPKPNAQAIYLAELYNAAKILYEEKIKECTLDNFPFPIDPQGRVILEVSLNNEAWARIYEQLNNGQKSDPVLLDNFKTNFVKELGHPITETTSLSWDIQTVNGINPALKTQLETHLADTKDKENILLAYQGIAKGRIIGLQQETHFHAHLIGRVLQQAISSGEKPKAKADREEIFGNTEAQLHKGINQALNNLNKEVLGQQAIALEKAYKKTIGRGLNQHDFALALNKELDKARKKLLPQIMKEIRKEVIKSTGVQFSKDITKYLSKELAEKTSGSAHDFVHIDKGIGFISYFGANEQTSHHRQFGADSLADRMMYSHHLTSQNQIQPLSDRQQVRVPSIAVKKIHKITQKLLEKNVSKKTEEELERIITTLDKKQKISSEDKKEILRDYQAINALLNKQPTQNKEAIKQSIHEYIVKDTEQKIIYLQEKYNLGGDSRLKSSSAEALPNAFVYNLYTSINKGITGSIDEKSNKQTQSAEDILEAAHLYNRNNPTKPLCLVQNMAVNGWGYELSLNEKNPPVVNEAALMAQMASLHTVYEAVESQEDKNRINDIFTQYDKFLKTKESSFYNYLKSQPQALEKLESLGKQLSIKQSVNSESISGLEAHRSAFMNNSQNALAALFKEGAFSHHENGYTYQALSVFVEQSSIGGCKSANERAQAVNGRVSVLDFISIDKTTREQILDNYLSEEEASRLKMATNNLEESITQKDLVGINQNINTLYESLNLEGFQAVISFIDQGGHAKLATKGTSLLPNTNNAETVQTATSATSQWQAHKGIGDYLKQEFEGVQPFNWKKEIGKEIKNALLSMSAAVGTTGVALGIAAAIGVTAGFPPAGLLLGVAAGVGLVAFALCKVLPKWWASREAATQVRFNAIQDENQQWIAQAKEGLVQEQGLVQDSSKIMEIEKNIDSLRAMKTRSSSDRRSCNQNNQSSSSDLGSDATLNPIISNL